MAIENTINFGNLPREYSSLESSAVAIVPVAYDGTSVWVKSASKGPQAILEASASLELFDIETQTEVFRQGIFTDEPIEGDIAAEQMISETNDLIHYHLEEGRFPIVIGGEHCVSIGAMQVQARKYENLTILQLDAHSGLCDQYEVSKYNHSCIMARAKELAPIIQVGIRSMDVSEKNATDSDHLFLAHDIHENHNWFDKVVSKLSDNVYVTIDLDVLDPAIMPSTGSPEPGGLQWYDTLALLRKVFTEKNVVGFDIVELCPNPDNKAPDFLAAKLLYKAVTYKFAF
jgi:agmatinase